MADRPRRRKGFVDSRSIAGHGVPSDFDPDRTSVGAAGAVFAVQRGARHVLPPVVRDHPTRHDARFSDPDGCEPARAHLAQQHDAVHLREREGARTIEGSPDERVVELVTVKMGTPNELVEARLADGDVLATLPFLFNLSKT